jgi:hypothetical protein
MTRILKVSPNLRNELRLVAFGGLRCGVKLHLLKKWRRNARLSFRFQIFETVMEGKYRKGHFYIGFADKTYFPEKKICSK